jgi:hypothetical protein
VTDKQANTIHYLWGKDYDDIATVMSEIIDHNRLGCLSVADASEMIDLFNASDSDDIDDHAAQVYKKLLASWRHS